MTIRLPAEVQERLNSEASRRGLAPDEYATRLISQNLPASPSPTRNSIRELFEQWKAEDHTDDPAEIARRDQEVEELEQALNRNRLEMEGPGSRKLIP